MSIKSIWRVFLLVYFAVLSVAFLQTMTKRRVPMSPVFGVATAESVVGQNSTEAFDLANFALGARVQASSYNKSAQHLPLFAIDGAVSKDPLQKWASDPHDAAPWIAVLLPTPFDIDAVTIFHAGKSESNDYTIRDYTIECLSGEVTIQVARVAGNRLPVARHSVQCPSTSEVRIQFDIEKNSARAVTRVYEIKLEGRPIK